MQSKTHARDTERSRIHGVLYWGVFERFRDMQEEQVHFFNPTLVCHTACSRIPRLIYNVCDVKYIREVRCEVLLMKN